MKDFEVTKKVGNTVYKYNLLRYDLKKGLRKVKKPSELIFNNKFWKENAKIEKALSDKLTKKARLDRLQRMNLSVIEICALLDMDQDVKHLRKAELTIYERTD